MADGVRSEPGGVIPPHGGYRGLRCFQVAQQAYVATVAFSERFVDLRARTRDQMVQAARSGVQNIAEGSVASATSKMTEMKLIGAARASLEELLLDFEDFLRQRRLKLWDRNDPRALAVRQRYRTDASDSSDPSDPYGIRTADPETAANSIICIVHQASFLLGKQLRRLEMEFLEHGGTAERLWRERRQRRG